MSAEAVARSKFTPAERALCEELAGRGTRCTLLSGSYARGWEHQHSDVDVIVVGPVPESSATSSRGGILRHLRYLDGKRWEIEYYTPVFVDKLVDAIVAACEVMTCGGDPLTVFDSYELGRALRLNDGVALSGADRAVEYQRRLHQAGLGRVVTQLAVDGCDAAIDDALGLLATGDRHSAVLAASAAFGYAIDACLARHDQLTPGVKWRYRKYLALAEPGRGSAPPLDAETCWRLLTLADLNTCGADSWVRDVIEKCQGILFDITETTS